MIIMLRDGDNTFDQLEEFRRIFEPELCELAAERITPEEIEALRWKSEIPLDDTVEDHINRYTDFHMAIARAARTRFCRS